MFDHTYSLFSFKHDYDPDVLNAREQTRLKKQKKQEKRQRFSKFLGYNKQAERNALHNINQQIEDETEYYRQKM